MVDSDLIARSRILPNLIANMGGATGDIPELALECELLLHGVHRVIHESDEDENNDENNDGKDDVSKELERRDEE